MSRSRRSHRLLLLPLVLAVMSAAWAEVGVVLTSNGDVLNSYVLAVVTDDSSPIPAGVFATSASKTRHTRQVVNLDINEGPSPSAITEDGDPIGASFWEPATGGGTVMVVTDDPDIPVWVSTAAPPQGTRVLLNPQGASTQDGPPSLAIHSVTGIPIVAWARKGSTGHDMVFSTFSNSTWASPRLIAASPAPELDPQIAIDPQSGDVHLVYWVGGMHPVVFHMQAPQDLSSWSAPEVVSAPGEIALRPSIAFHDGALVVAYESHPMGAGTAPRQIVVATRGAGGFEARVLASTHYVGPNRPAVHSDGSHLWVDWVDSVTSMAWVRRTANGWGTLRFEPYSSTQDREFFARGRILEDASAD